MGAAAAAAGVASAALAFAATCVLVRIRSRRVRTGRDGQQRIELTIGRLLFAVRSALPGLVSRVGRRDSALLLARAGLDGRFSVRDVAAARLVGVALGAALVVRIAAMVPMRMLPIVGFSMLVLAAELPILWLRRRAEIRARSMREALPDALELMRACLAAGLALRRSLALVGDHCAEPLATEFVQVVAETAFGVSQATALDGLAARNPQPEIRALVSAIRQAEKHGSPLAPVIAAQAHDARLALNREIVERAAKAGPKIQLIVSTTIVPAALLGFAAVLIAAIARGDIAFV